MNYLTKRWRVILVSVILISIAIALVINKEAKTSNSSTENAATVTLSISGEVVSPGRYTIKKGSSIWDNAYMYGGFTPFADLGKTDIYEPVTKDTHVTIKSKSSKESIDQLYEIPGE